MKNNDLYKASEEIGCPLTIGQKGLWFLHQLDPLSDRYHMPLTFKFSDEVRVEDLGKVLTTFIDWHTILKSTFHETNGSPYRKINLDHDHQISEHDIGPLQHSELLHKVRCLSELPFNLEQGPLIRAHVLNVKGADRILLIVIHHLIFDGASLKILCTEFDSIYQSLHLENNKLVDSDINFNTFQVWQNKWLQSDDAQSSREYWLKKLSGELPQLNLVDKSTTPINEPVRGEFIKFQIPAAIVGKFKHLATEYKCSEYVIWLSAYFSFLSAYTSQNDIVIGTASMGRPDVKFDQMIGYFVNLIPLRYQFKKQQSFIDVINSFKNEVFESLMHADYPLAELVNALADREQRGDQPLFQTTFVWTVTEQLKPVKNSKLGLEIYPLVHESGEQDISLELLPAHDGMKALFKYRTNSFSVESVLRIKNAFLSFIQSISIEADSLLQQVSLVSDKDENYLLHTINQTQAGYQKKSCIHQLFEEQVKATPDVIAVVCDQQSISYDELNQQANQLAHHLLTQGIKPDDFVGICLEKSVAMVIAILAIWKAGAAYLPLDYHYPQERIKLMVKDSKLSIILTQKKLEAVTTDIQQAKLVVDSDELMRTISTYPINNPLVNGLNSKHLAYIIYTSGSTGKAKAVMIEHHSVINLCTNINSDLASKQLRNWGWVAPLSFDASIQGLCALVTGQTLQIISKQVKTDQAKLKSLLTQNTISILDCTPTLLEYWFNIGLAPILPDLLIGGEVISHELWNRLIVWQKQYNRIANNVYGPTETCVDCSMTLIEGNTTNIGKALNNVYFIILDENKRLLPYGRTGELYIGGAGLARGYLNQPDLTSQRFIQHPFSYDSNDILFRTGDSVRYFKNNQLEFVGRIDNQIKIRGFRIELGEIEQQILAHPNINASIVVVFDNGNEKQLVAYVSSDSSIEESELIDSLRSNLYSYLPDYMVPTTFITLEKFPLTSNGKIDRKALPEPNPTVLSSDYLAPIGETELILVDLWSNLLNIPTAQISADAHFFTLGGHSLLVAQLINSIKQKTQLQIAYKDVFTYPTIRNLSNAINNKLRASSLIELLKESKDDSIDELEW